MWSILLWPVILVLTVGLLVVVAIAVTIAVAGQDFSDQPHRLNCPDCGRKMLRGSETCPHCGARFS